MAIRLGSSTPSKLYLGATEVTKAYLGASVAYEVGGGGAWTPAELGASLSLWLDAEDASTITLNGSTISQWRDKSGNSRHASQAVAANQPAYTAGGLNSRNVVTHTSSKFLIIPDVYFPYQSAFVLYSDTSTTNFTTALGARYNGTNAAYHGNTDATKLFSTQYTSPETLNGSNFANGVSIGNGQTTPRPATPTIFSFIATSQFDTNRRLQTIGTDASIRDSRTINGLIAEVVILEAAASTADRQKLEGYLAWKWGLEANLPADHPYKSAPPISSPYDPDAQAYFDRVEGPSGDNQTLETGVKDAINAFVIGCKADGIWNAIKTSAILAGARTLSGALQPLVGNAPTNFNFVAGDYNRKTGLKGNGSTKYLNTNVAPLDGLQNSAHYSTYVTSLAGAAGMDYIGATQTTPFNSFSQIIDNSPQSLNVTLNMGAGFNMPPGSGNTYTGFFGADRPNASTVNARYNGTNLTASLSSATPTNLDYYVFGRNLNGVANRLSDRSHVFYSIGESLNLALLDSRVSTLITKIGEAIP